MKKADNGLGTWIAVVLIAILIGSCSQQKFSDKQRDEISDIAADVADASVNESAKVAELQSRVDNLESEIEDLKSRLGE
jgi:polyhydroxyalkanoate synthesis regulator phasin